MLKELKRKHRITFVTLDDGLAGAAARTQAEEYCNELVCVPHRQREKFTLGFYAELLLNLGSPKPYAVNKYESPLMTGEIVERTQKGEFEVLICDFLAPAGNVPPNLPIPTILFQHNVEAMIWKRHYEMQSNVIKKAYLFGQWRKMRSFEERTCRRFGCVVAVSPEDREQMREMYSLLNVFDVPTGVDIDFFRPRTKETVSAHNVVFTGSMDWLPNEDAIRYFTGQIMPLIRKAIPDFTLTVVGRNPYPGLIELTTRDPSIIVTGRVEDVRPYMERAAAYVVPLRIGGGTRLKIFEAMAMEKAIVSTSIGAEGLPVKDGVDLLLADTPETFADSVVRLLCDPAAAGALGRHAAARVREQFGWQRVAESFAEICECAIRARNSPVAALPVVNGNAQSAA